MDEDDDISKQIMEMVWSNGAIKLFTFTYLGFNLLMLVLITVILFRCAK